jgi:hypothetical protein
MPIFVKFSAWRAGRKEPVQFGTESAHKSGAASGNTTPGDRMRKGQHLRGGEHQQGLGEASYCGLCQAKTAAALQQHPQPCPVRREGWIAGCMPVAKRFTPSTPQRGNSIFHPWHPKTTSGSRPEEEGRLAHPPTSNGASRAGGGCGGEGHGDSSVALTSILPI